eukprot:scaffold4596_cov114-Skeletonema_marinoi.AAC.2
MVAGGDGDIRGDIKIFDFGLAKELKPCDREGHDQYYSDGLAGTRRYMAPELLKFPRTALVQMFTPLQSCCGKCSHSIQHSTSTLENGITRRLLWKGNDPISRDLGLS